jgi:hypothetical protein
VPSRNSYGEVRVSSKVSFLEKLSHKMCYKVVRRQRQEWLFLFHVCELSNSEFMNIFSFQKQRKESFKKFLLKECGSYRIVPAAFGDP